jgi:predicted nucleic acid-binding protein
MTTAIDTNIISALWNADDTLNRAAQGALDAQFGRETLVISGVVYAELLVAPKQTESFLDGFCKEAGIGVDWELGERVLRVAGVAFRGYAGRRRKQEGVEPGRILADFLIGAHALVHGYKLLTLDEGMYRAAFPRLGIVAV